MMTDEDKNEKDEAAAAKAKLDAQLASGQLEGAEYNKQVVDLVVPEVDGGKVNKEASIGYKIRKSPFFHVGLSVLISIISMVRPAFFASEKFRKCNAGGWPEGNCFSTAIEIPLQMIIVPLLIILPLYFASVAKSKIKNTKFRKTLMLFDVAAFLLAVVSIVKMFWAF